MRAPLAGCAFRCWNQRWQRAELQNRRDVNYTRIPARRIQRPEPELVATRITLQRQRQWVGNERQVAGAESEPLRLGYRLSNHTMIDRITEMMMQVVIGK